MIYCLISAEVKLDAKDVVALKRSIWESDVNKQYRFSCRNRACRYTVERGEPLNYRECPECGTEVKEHKMARDDSWRIRVDRSQ
jgi:rRNA maturation endonuclease Nob1